MRVPDLTLERHRLGELSVDEAVRLQQQLSVDALLRQRLDALERSDNEIVRAYPPAELTARVLARLREPGARELSRSARVRPLLIPVGLLAVLLLLILPYRSWSPGYAPVSPGESSERPKGPLATLTIYRKTANTVELLHDGDTVRAGDVIRVGYRTSGPGFAVILSVDGRGMTTVHLPAQGSAASEIQTGGDVLLDQAFELDDAPSLERFFLVTAPAPFDVDVVLSAIDKTGYANATPALALRAPFTVTIFTLRKDVRP